jgi:hypothetical protein
MNHPQKTWSTAALCLLAGMILAVWAASASAAGIGFHNQLKINIYVEAATIFKGREIRSKPILIRAGKVGWHLNVPRGLWEIRIYDGNQPSRRLFTGRVEVKHIKQLFFYSVKPLKNKANLPLIKVKPAQPPKQN